MIKFIYLLLALFATFFGSITGMGGGVIMKPVMDLMGHFDAASIGALSSITVLSMAIVSCIKQAKNKNEINLSRIAVLGAGAAGGGIGGQYLFELIKKSVSNDSIIKIIQNAVLVSVILIIFVYMIKKDKFKAKRFSHPIIYIVTGIVLGLISAFLGVGGGPINVAVLMYLFSMDIKSAAFASLLVIIFSQTSKLITLWATTGFAVLDLKVLPYMVVAAIVGSLAGSFVKKKCNEKAIVYFFNIMQILIIAACAANIIILAV